MTTVVRHSGWLSSMHGDKGAPCKEAVSLSTRSISLFPTGIHSLDTTSGKGLYTHRIKGASGMHCVQEGADLWEKRLFLS